MKKPLGPTGDRGVRVDVELVGALAKYEESCGGHPTRVSCLTATVKDVRRPSQHVDSRSVADRAVRGGADQPGVLPEDASRVPRGQRREVCATLRELLVVHEQVEGPGADVHPDLVAVPDQGDRTAVDSLGGDVTDAQAGGPTGETAVGEEQHVLAQTRALDRSGDGEHLAHPGATLGALVADD